MLRILIWPLLGLALGAFQISPEDGEPVGAPQYEYDYGDGAGLTGTDEDTYDPEYGTAAPGSYDYSEAAYPSEYPDYVTAPPVPTAVLPAVEPVCDSTHSEPATRLWLMKPTVVLDRIPTLPDCEKACRDRPINADGECATAFYLHGQRKCRIFTVAQLSAYVRDFDCNPGFINVRPGGRVSQVHKICACPDRSLQLQWSEVIAKVTCPTTKEFADVPTLWTSVCAPRKPSS